MSFNFGFQQGRGIIENAERAQIDRVRNRVSQMNARTLKKQMEMQMYAQKQKLLNDTVGMRDAGRYIAEVRASIDAGDFTPKKHIEIQAKYPSVWSSDQAKEFVKNNLEIANQTAGVTSRIVSQAAALANEKDFIITVGREPRNRYELDRYSAEREAIKAHKEYNKIVPHDDSGFIDFDHIKKQIEHVREATEAREVRIRQASVIPRYTMTTPTQESQTLLQQQSQLLKRLDVLMPIPGSDEYEDIVGQLREIDRKLWGADEREGDATDGKPTEQKKTRTPGRTMTTPSGFQVEAVSE